MLNKTVSTKTVWLVILLEVILALGIFFALKAYQTYAELEEGYQESDDYTLQQQSLYRDQLEQENPELASSVNSQTLDAHSLTAIEAQNLQNQVELAKFREAADAFAAEKQNRVKSPLGYIIIPKLGVNVVMVQGDYNYKGSYLKEGPGHWPESRFPGQGGNFVLSGHRTTYGKPFEKLNELQPGDQIKLVLPYAEVYYTVTRQFVVLETDTSPGDDQGVEMTTLMACHPPHRATERIVVQAEMSGFVLIDSQ